MMAFHDEAQKAVSQGHSWPKVREATSEIQSSLRNMKFEVPSEGEEAITKKVSRFFFLFTLHALTISTVRGAAAEADREVRLCHRRVRPLLGGAVCIAEAVLSILLNIDCEFIKTQMLSPEIADDACQCPVTATLVICLAGLANATTAGFDCGRAYSIHANGCILIVNLVHHCVQSIPIY